ncbi:hypothetical protein JAAARDRAFT_694627 [Jaapia argillacea MUCL 33604]|uniref:Hemimethylated DNA-binding domain-containing protein n=1 Tax=Jaapia argillacea MUCL 33604 TaxID=933084 RepID=A0A067Q899_9AGAM|nr:hypothetical protein JAAARDRAFT_694627 [Jaapia argillacea MUCL 33604]
MSYPWLPHEIYVHILSQLPPRTNCDSSVKVLAECSLVNSDLRNAASLSALWQPHYRIRYHHSVPSREATRREVCNEDYRLMYFARRRLDRRALRILEGVITDGRSRHDGARELVRDLSFDVWDTLNIEIHRPLPRGFRFGSEGGEDSQEELDDHERSQGITRMFWAKTLLGSIARSNAVQEWGRLLHPQPGAPEVTFEDALTGLSAFFAISPHEISNQLDALSERCRAYLTSRHRSLDSASPEFDLADTCAKICDFLRDEGFQAASSNRFHNLFNHFPHSVLSTNKKTLPMSLVYLFVAISRRLGIVVSPIDFPVRVIAHVASGNPTTPDILVDVYGSSSKAILSVSDDIPERLLAAGVLPSEALTYIMPSPASQLLLRTTRNIIGSFQIMNEAEISSLPHVEFQSASYAAICATLLLIPNNNILERVAFPNWPLSIDAGPVLLDGVVPLLPPRDGRILERRCKEIMDNQAVAETPSFRSRAAKRIKFFVGMFFQHIRFAYVGLIVGWQPTCMASENWIANMGVDHLQHGRHQPFFNVITVQGSPRYVAQENISPWNPTEDDIRDFFQGYGNLGMYFRDVDRPEHCGSRGRLLLSQELHEEYPEDDNAGKQWVMYGSFD